MPTSLSTALDWCFGAPGRMSLSQEARVMAYVRSQGFPVPAVRELSEDGLSMVLERIDGADMVAVLGKRPWEIRRQGRTLADLHRRLHELTGPDWLPDAPIGRGDRLLHLDLHPLDVMMSPTGPVVIDWPNAGPAIQTSTLLSHGS